MTATSKRRVMGFGTFDAVHPGHLFYLNELRKLGDELIVVIARDANVERIKGKRPHFDEKERLRAVAATGLADRVMLGHETDFMQVIYEYEPHIIGFGYDQRVKFREIKKTFPDITLIRLKSFEPNKYKSSLIKAVLFG